MSRVWSKQRTTAERRNSCDIIFEEIPRRKLDDPPDSRAMDSSRSGINEESTAAKAFYLFTFSFEKRGSNIEKRQSISNIMFKEEKENFYFIKNSSLFKESNEL